MFILVRRPAGDEVLSLPVQLEALVDLDDVVPHRLHVVVEETDIGRLGLAINKFGYTLTTNYLHSRAKF